MKTLFCSIMLLLLIQSCTSSEIGDSKDVNPDAIYQSYNVSYTEGDENVRVFCQFRFAGKNGTTLVLSQPGGIDLDGDKLPVDSGTISGAYYSVYKPFTGFTGSHTITYADINGRKTVQNFEFTPFKIAPAIPVEIAATDMTISFKGLKDGDLVHVEVEDTSSSTDDIDVIDTVRDGQVIIKGAQLAALKSGPLDMGFYKESTAPLDYPTSKEGGVINIAYKLASQKTTLKK